MTEFGPGGEPVKGLVEKATRSDWKPPGSILKRIKRLFD